MRLNRPPTDVHHLTPSTEAGPGEVYRRPVPTGALQGTKCASVFGPTSNQPCHGCPPQGANRAQGYPSEPTSFVRAYRARVVWRGGGPS